MKSYQTLAQYILWRPHLDTLFHVLQAADIPFLVLKGWAFIPDLYADPLVGRPLGDVDLLVHPEKFQAAVQLILGLGYQPGSNNPRYGYDQKSSQLPFELAFYNGAGVSLDLHRHIFPTYWSTSAYPIDMAVVWASRQPFQDWGGNTLARLSPALNFIHLITHITRHGLPDADQKSYQDLMRLVRKYEAEMDWAQVNHLVIAWQLQGALYFVRGFCQRKFQFQFPSALASDWQPGMLWRWLVEAVLTPSWERNPERSHWLSRALLNLLMVEKPGTALRLVWRVIFPAAEQRYHLHGYPISLGHHYFKLARRVLGVKTGKTTAEVLPR